jgi:multisubunit Na+/H+ antiporter MnhB subunit
VFSLLKESGVTGIIVALVVFTVFEYAQHAGIPFSANAAFALAALLFLIAMVLRRVLSWFKQKRTPPTAANRR